MRPDHSPTRRHRVWLASLAVALLATGLVVVTPASPAGAAPRPAVAGHLDWGVKASFRAYVTGPIAGGSITPGGGASTNADGSFRFPLASGSRDDAATVSTSHTGSVRFAGHGGALDLRLSDLRVSISGTTGSLVGDALTKGFTDPTPVLHDDVTLATLDLTSITPVTTADTATYSAVPVTLTAAGSVAFAGFYPAGTAMDPLTLRIEHVPVVPTITVSTTSGIHPEGEVVTVTGTGFDPSANPSTRPPVPTGMPAGIYVVFGRFAPVWKPSAGAPAPARQVISQRWPMPQSSIDAAVAAFGPNPQYVPLQPDGSFTTTLLVKPDDTKAGTYAVATWAGGGAVPNPAHELFVPIGFRPETGIDAATSTDVVFRGHRDRSRVKVTVTNVGTGTVWVGGDDVTFEVTEDGSPTGHEIVPKGAPRRPLAPGRSRVFSADWVHGPSLTLADRLSVRACVTLTGDDRSSNDCDAVTVPSDPVDLAVVTTAGPARLRSTAWPVTVAVTNQGSGPVVVRPADVSFVVARDGSPTGASPTPVQDPARRRLIRPGRTLTFAFSLPLSGMAEGDLLELTACVAAPADAVAGNDCAGAAASVGR